MERGRWKERERVTKRGRGGERGGEKVKERWDGVTSCGRDGSRGIQQLH